MVRWSEMGEGRGSRQGQRASFRRVGVCWRMVIREVWGRLGEDVDVVQRAGAARGLARLNARTLRASVARLAAVQHAHRSLIMRCVRPATAFTLLALLF